MILSLQGCMAVGKTTAARYLEQHCQQVQVCFEDNAAVLAEIKQRGLNKNSYADYLEIQRLFLRNELRRGQKAKKYPHAVMDFGAEEIEFYTLNYPKSRGLEWKIEAIRQALAPELAAVQACMPEHILFLDASEAVLRARKAGDTTRSREFFAYYKVDKKKQNDRFLSTAAFKKAPREPQSRQKRSKTTVFCLPPTPNPVRAVPKVEQNP